MIYFFPILTINFFLLLKEYVQLPKHFYQPLKRDIPIRVVFKDKIGTNIKIVLLKFLYRGYFTCLFFVKYYDLLGGTWIKFNYIGGKDFDI